MLLLKGLFGLQKEKEYAKEKKVDAEKKRKKKKKLFIIFFVYLIRKKISFL